ncbi:M14 family metallopeptidase [Euzebyella saccharophila]|uniref:M14 family metallopeptidase n=1 Tax=Euzebyella saccharophila TaxID=679664 RepID=A0ABV8JRN7_9FLAO|nr:M14 family metallopeptidase [Euzebyella saccharophila]
MIKIRPLTKIPFLTKLAIAVTFFAISCESEKEDNSKEYETHFEASQGTETATYLQVIDFYIQLAKEFPEINMQTVGQTDSGFPLHIITYNPDGDFNFQKINDKKTIVLINNGIHPGESDGIDATMLLYRDLAIGKLRAPEKTILVTIPIYNIGGALNRNSTTRVNQNGPVSYGFRGNTLNYDLNRDFIKADTKNTRSFYEIFHLVNPDIFIDNHVSNGADYQYTLTHLFTQHNKLGGDLGNYLHQKFMPELEGKLKKEDWDITPYVNVFNKVPESGFSQFMDHPRYSTGYTTLWNVLGLMVETHMLKPYKQRVEGTYALMKNTMDIAEENFDQIKQLRTEALHRHKNWDYYPTQWAVDTTRTTELKFLGFEADTLTSEVTNLQRLKYDRNRPFEKKVDYQNFYKPVDSVKIPESYILKRGWSKVTELLDLNNIDYTTFQKDTIITVESYSISSFSTRNTPYEGHYLHDDTELKTTTKKIKFQQGDINIPTDQKGIRYLMEVLEPTTADSFFNWNFFDSILQQKEGFSPYVFEDLALKILEENPTLKDSLFSKKEDDPTFAQNWYAQLDYIYKNSRYNEQAHNQYPVYRVLKKE